ncbi:Nn.00g078630.m01.CDS01 [Neocucurbitaria sp. VM-36]
MPIITGFFDPVALSVKHSIRSTARVLFVSALQKYDPTYRASYHMPPNHALPSREDYINSLVPVQTCSAANSCPICLGDYNTEHPPILLLGCGHIFGQPCILKWFTEGANLCPLDRKKLFTLPTEMVDEGDNDRSSQHLLPFRVRSASVEQRRRRIRRTRGRSNYLFFEGQIIGFNGQLTREGCCRLVRDVWQQTRQIFRQLTQTVHDLNVLSVSEELSSGSIDVALLLGVRIPGIAQGILIEMMRMLLVVWCGEGWLEPPMPEEDIQRWADEMWALYGQMDDRLYTFEQQHG